MEFYGSIGLISGSVTASVFSGSFVGDADGLYNIQASGVTGLNLSQIANGSNTASVSTDGFNINTDTSITGSVNISGSISLNGEAIGTGKLNETTFNSYVTASDSRIGSLESSTGSINTTITNLSSSIATTDLNQNNRLNTIETTYATTGSNTFKGDQDVSGSIIPTIDNAFDLGSVTHQWRDVYISSGSLYIDGTKVLGSSAQELTITTDNGQSLKLLEGTTDSIILQTADGNIELKSSADGDILLDPTNGKITLKGSVEVLNGQKIQSSVNGTPVVFASDLVVSGSIDITGTIEGINLTDFSSSVNTRIGNTETSVTSLNSFTSSASTRLGSLETESGSIRTTVNNYTSSVDGKLSSIETVTGSILTINTTQDGRLDSIEGKTGSLATTGSNTFQGNQTITGSLYVSENLIIAGSSSIQHISSSVLNIADNIITVNAQNPAVRFGGISVIDSGSYPQVSGSLLFDSTENEWLFVHQNQSSVTSALLIMGPETYNDLGNEIHLTNNRLVKSINDEHIGDSNISDDGTTVTISSNTVINGTFSSTGTTLVSGSSQISFTGISDKPTLVSGSSQISYTGITDKPTLVSGSSQISFSGISGLPTLVSGSSQISFTGLSNIPGGLVSGSSQIDLTSTTNYASGILTRLNAVGVFSGSAQVTGIGNSQLTNSSFYVGTTSISLGRASASQTLTGVSIDGNAATASSVNFANIAAGTRTNYTIDFKPPSSGNYAGFAFSKSTSADAAQDAGFLLIRGGTDNDIYTAEGITLVADAGWLTLAQRTSASKGIRLMTGTSAPSTRFQILTDGTIKLSSLTSNGFVKTSGSDGTLSVDTTTYFSTSSQVTLSSTTGFGTYLNQAVLTTSSPSFAGLTVSGTVNISGGSSGGFTNSTLSWVSGTGGGLKIDSPGTNLNIGTGWNEQIILNSGNGVTINTNNGSGAYTSRFAIDRSGNTTVGGNLTFSSQGSKVTFGDSTSGSPSMIGEGLVDTFGSDSDFLTIYARNSLRIYSAGTNEVFRFTAASNYSYNHIVPGTNNTYNLGSASLGWANVYTNDLHLSNMNKPEGNDIDGTNGTWTIQEGAENLYIINNNNGKKFKISLEEII